MDRIRTVGLSWEGKADLLAAGDGAPSTVPRRTWSTDDGGSSLLEGDNLDCLLRLASEAPDRAALAYLDPPFFTNREHQAWLRKAGSPRGAGRTRVPAFDDRWPDLQAWLDALGRRLAAVRRLLAPHGSIVVHVDPKTSHYVKVLGDEIFGWDAFASEIVWRYRRWPSKTPNFQRVHDVLLRWRKDPRAAPRWNQPYEPLAASTLATWGTNKQRAVFDAAGRRRRSSSTEERTRGVPMGDVWDIGVIAPISRERTGYPSQKPEALLERLLRALSDPGDLVVDPYAGSGTTLAVAWRLRRRFIGIDASPVAIEIVRARVAELGAELRPQAGPGGGGTADPATPRAAASARQNNQKRTKRDCDSETNRDTVPALGGVSL
ncbi:MAG TPA: site-specific DNA-methyltransferase [Polyangiaceae bacterium]|nr:site-specific DNA-methyltransferase [Polyangiaceae bacterium]